MYEDGKFKDKWSYLNKNFEINSNPYDLLNLVYNKKAPKKFCINIASMSLIQKLMIIKIKMD